jgi:tetratricopeptide (TPR) repeat protein
MMSRGALALGFVLGISAFGRPARAADESPSAQAADDARRADAKARYEQGVAAYTSGRFKDAVDLFLAADRLSPSAPLSFNIARAYEKLGDDAGALRWYRDYLRRSPAAKNASEVEELVRRYESLLAAKGVQQVTLLSNPAGATIEIDGGAVGVTPGTFELAPGRHRVTLMLRGYDDLTRELELPADHALDATFELVAASAAPAQAAAPGPLPAQAPTAPAAAHAHHGLGPWPYIALGTGAAALAGALTFELLRRSSENAAEDATTQVEYKDKLDQMESRRTAARVLVGVGGALVATGGVLLGIELAGRKNTAHARLTLVPADGGCAASLAGAF